MKHPLHPALVHFPIATWTLATCADVAGLWYGDAAWRYAAPLHVVGSLTALAAVAAGLIDFMKLPVDSPAAKYVTRHVALVACAWLAYGASLVLRYHEHRLQDPTTAAIATDNRWRCGSPLGFSFSRAFFSEFRTTCASARTA